MAVIGNGQQLYVSHNTIHSHVRTIHSHVRSIYRKLGVSTQARPMPSSGPASSGSSNCGAWLPACVPARFT
jgi:hypothetical protein